MSLGGGVRGRHGYLARAVVVPVNFESIAAEAWERAMLESPDPFRTDVFNGMFGLPTVSYRDRLTQPRYNYLNQRIPQIVLVRANLRRLGKPTQTPRLP